jgi:hypothetical protein
MTSDETSLSVFVQYPSYPQSTNYVTGKNQNLWYEFLEIYLI